MKSKKIVALIMAALLATTAFTACSSNEESSKSSESSTSSKEESSKSESSEDEIELVGNTYATGLPIAKDAITYKLFNVKGDLDLSGSQNEKPIAKIGEEGTNVKIEWTESNSAAAAEQLGLILSTGRDLPDGFFNSNITDVQLAKNTGLFFEFTEENLSKFAPNIYNGMMENVDGGLDQLKKADGKIYTLPVGSWSIVTSEAQAVTFINTDYLAKAKVEMPTTVDEFYDVLVALKASDYNENGVEDEIPYVFAQSNWAGKIQAMAAFWGMAGRNLNDDQWFGRVEDGKYVLNITEDRFKDFLLEMNKWYQAGLIPMDGFSMTGPEFGALQNQNLHAVFTAWTPSDSSCWAPLPVLSAKGYEGQELKNGQKGARSASMNGFAISKQCKEPEGLLRWWDNLHKDAETKRIGLNGEEGYLFKTNEDGTATSIQSDEFPAGIANSIEYGWTYGWPGGPISFGDELAQPDMSIASDDKLRAEYSEFYRPYFATEFLPETPVPIEAQEDFAMVQVEIQEAVKQFMANSVTSGLSDEQWEKFKTDLTAYGIEEWVTYYQNWIDGSWN